MPNQTDIAYLAGFFDGEGCIQINKTDSELMKKYGKSARHYLMISANQINPFPILLLQKHFGGTIYVRNKTGPKRRLGVWRLQGRRAAIALSTLLPWLIVKRDEAELALRFQASFNTKRSTKLTETDFLARDNLKEEMHRYKKREWAWDA